MPFKYESLRARLDANSKPYVLRPDLELPCRIWQGTLNANGYGHFSERENGKVKKRLAHRASLEDHLGRKLGRWLTRHVCDNRPCIEPSHLIGGTQRQNMRDALERGRHPSQIKIRASKFPGLVVA